MHLPAKTLADFREALAEVAVGHDDHARTGLDEIRKARFHCRRARSRHSQRGRTFGRTEEPTERVPHLVHRRQELRIEVTEHGRGQDAHDARRHQAWAGAEQDARDGWNDLHACT